MNLAGRRIVLGVTGGIAAYKAVEVCRRLVDAGAHVAPGPHRGRHPLRRRDHLLGAGLRAGADLAVATSSRPDPAHPARARAPTSSSWPRPPPGCCRPTPSGFSDDLLTATLLATRAPVVVCPAMHTEMWEHPAVQDNLAHAALAGACIVVPPERAASPAATSAPAAWPSPPTSSPRSSRCSAPAERPRRAPRARHRRRHPRGHRPGAGHHQPLVGQAGPRHRRRGRRPRRQGHPRHHRRRCRSPPASRSSTVVSAAEMQAAVMPIAADARRHRHGRRGRRLPPGGRRRPQDQEGATARPRRSCSSRPTTSSSTSARAKPAGQVLVGFAAETDDLLANAREKLERKNLDLIVANDVARPRRRLRARHQRGRDPHAPTACEHDVPLTDKRSVARAVLDAVVALRTARPDQPTTSGRPEPRPTPPAGKEHA